jgi:pyrroline-5-carboxylate reductase
LQRQIQGEESMLECDKIAFVGSGAMGEAIIRVSLEQQLFAPQQVVASDIRPQRCQELADRYGIGVTADNVEGVREASIVVLSVKPQVLPAVLDGLRGSVPQNAVVLSIVAGARIASLTEGLQHTAVIRSMPNTPAQIGMGMTVWTASADTSDEQRNQVRTLLQAMGEEIYLQDESKLDTATAVSGSGPAYVFLFMEAMLDAAVRLGFARPVARQLVLQTVLGSASFAKSGKHLAELRNMVTSPGGTTAEALHQFERGSLRAVVSEAIEAAYQKSKDLARKE